VNALTLYVAVRIRGTVDVSPEVSRTLYMLRLRRKFTATLYHRGFTPRRSKAGYHKTVMNVGDLAEIVDRLKSTGKAKMEDGMVEVNLADMGVEKLLGEGEIMVPVKVIVGEASETAVKKIEEAGGKVVLLTKAQS
jgi:ribosomal protein L15